jgi:hypothetical protein
MMVWMKSMLARPAERDRKYPTALKITGWVIIVPKINRLRVRMRSWTFICFKTKGRRLNCAVLDNVDIDIFQCGVADFNIGDDVLFKQGS